MATTTYPFRFGPAALSAGVLLLISGLMSCMQPEPGPPENRFPTGVELTLFYDSSIARFDYPVWLGQFPDEEGTFVVGELGGDIRLLRVDSANQTTIRLFGHIPVALSPFNDGLLGLAFHPEFTTNRKYYVYYNSAKGRVRLAERTAVPGSPEDAGTDRELLSLPTADYPHNGGDLHFGPDGFLYLGIGDGATAGEFLDAQEEFGANAQSLSVLYGKMIRIDVDRLDSGLAYAIPPDNPFVGSADTGVRKEIWAFGLRNPWRWSFDPVDGRIFAGDVGLIHSEEINLIQKGGNYGWRRMDGTDNCFNDSDFWHPLPSCNREGITPPITEIRRSPPYPSRAIIGGQVFRGDTASPYYGAYIFGESITGSIYLLPADQQEGTFGQYFEIATGYGPLAGFGTDSKGNIYVVEYGGEAIMRLDHPDLTGKLGQDP